MKKSSLISFLIGCTIFSIGCNQNAPVSTTPSEPKDAAVAETYVFNGTEYEIRSVNGKIVEDAKNTESAKYIESIFDIPTCGYAVDPDDSLKVWLYTNESERLQTLQTIRKNIGLAKKYSDPMDIYVYTDVDFLGIQHSWRGHIKLEIPDLAVYNLTDKISSIIAYGYSGTSVTFYEHPNYGGHSMLMIGKGSIPDQRRNLKDWCMKRSWIGRCTTSWNDRISSLKY
jgi:hypothetical protein